MPNIFMPEGLIPLVIQPPETGTTNTADWINVGRAQKVWIDHFANVAAAAAYTITPAKAYDAAGASTAVLGFNAKIWYGHALAGAALVLARQTDAANFTTDATAGIHRVIFEIEVAALGREGSIPSLGQYSYLTCAENSLVADYICTTLWVLPRYQSDEVDSTTWIA